MPDPAVAALAAQTRPARPRPRSVGAAGVDVVAIHTDQVATEDPREAGAVHVGHQMWQTLALDPILAAAVSRRARGGSRRS